MEAFMRSFFAHPYTILLARLLLGFVFLRSGLGKVFDRKHTIQTTLAYNVLPPSLARLYGNLLPWMELSLAVLLILGLWTRAVAYSLGLLLISFGLAVSINLLRDKEMDCGCSGRRTQEKLSWRTLARIIVLLALALGVGWLDRGNYSLEGKLLGSSPAALSPPLIDFLPVLLTTLSLLAGAQLLLSVIAMQRDHLLLKTELSDQVPSKSL